MLNSKKGNKEVLSNKLRLPLWLSGNAKDARDLGQEDPLEKEMATHSSILAWRIPWTEEIVGLQSTRSLRVSYD